MGCTVAIYSSIRETQTHIPKVLKLWLLRRAP